MKINKLYDDVYEIEEFLTEQELSDVYTIINNTPEQDWFDEEAKNENNTPDFWYGKNLYFKSKWSRKSMFFRPDIRKFIIFRYSKLLFRIINESYMYV